MATIRVLPGAESAAARFATMAARGNDIVARVQAVASSSPFVPGDAVTSDAAADFARRSEEYATAAQQILDAIAQGSDAPTKALETLAEADRMSGKAFGQPGVSVSV
ncbi:hypothetical protein [Micromonospora sp. HM5-17]|jgi:hypothetical protein|uniref:hypothetical protein n=1 Tax=Micromonospora sp. HM5-17 TaxID=2487710 RepID=UPI0011CE794C|nr:hypothetical protein [Micromonospora sp. HM5-17]